MARRKSLRWSHGSASAPSQHALALYRRVLSPSPVDFAAIVAEQLHYTVLQDERIARQVKLRAAEVAAEPKPGGPAAGGRKRGRGRPGTAAQKPGQTVVGRGSGRMRAASAQMGPHHRTASRVVSA